MNIKNQKKAELDSLFLRQINQARKMGCSKKIIETLIKKYTKVLKVIKAIEFHDNMEEFIIVIPYSCWTKKSFLSFKNLIKGISEKDIIKFIKNKKEEAYFLIGVERGLKTSGMSCEEAAEWIRKKNLNGLNSQEMIALVMQTNILQERLIHSTEDIIDNKSVNIANQNGAMIIYLSSIKSKCTEWAAPYYLKKNLIKSGHKCLLFYWHIILFSY